MEETQRQNFDSPWKDIIATYFKDFMEFFFPKIASEIDWNIEPEFMEKEFTQISKESENQGSLADRLIKVYRKDGLETRVMVHIEIQSQQRGDFAGRVYMYNYRIHDFYKGSPVVSLAILADDNKNWRPSKFEREIWGCETCFTFPIAKLLDYEDRLQEIEESDKIFAIVTAAHLRTLRTRTDSQKRLNSKLEIIKTLYRKNFTKEEIINLYKFVDWLMILPKELELSFHEQLIKIEEANKMEYITTAERIGIEKGMLAGMQQGMQAGRLEGMQAGRLEGMQAGRLEGMQAGRLEGMQAGRLEGMQKGIKAGEIRGKLELWNNLLKKENLSKDIIEEAKRNIEDLTGQLKNLSYS